MDYKRIMPVSEFQKHRSSVLPFLRLKGLLFFCIIFLTIPVLYSCSGVPLIADIPFLNRPSKPVSPPEENLIAISEKGKAFISKDIIVNRPVQITYETDPVSDIAVSLKAEWLAFKPGGKEFSGLWIRSADPKRVILPREIPDSGSRASAPAISPDEKSIAYVGKGHDVKGDIFIVSPDGADQFLVKLPGRALIKPKGKALTRLTGRETADGSPCFSPDSRTVYFHQSKPGERSRRIVSINLGDEDLEPIILETNGDSAFPAISPDGSRCAFVSNRKDKNGDLYLKDLKKGTVFRLTNGPAIDIYPAWSKDAKYLYFTRFSIDTNNDGNISFEDNGVIWRLRLDDPALKPYPLTSAAYSAFHPMVTESAVYFLSTRKGVSNLWSLPLEGEIPVKGKAEEQFRLAKELEGRIPLDHHLSVLAYYSILERFPDNRLLGGRSAHAIGKLYEAMSMIDQAEAVYTLCSEAYNEVIPESIFSLFRMISFDYGRMLWSIKDQQRRKELIKEARDRIKDIAGQNPDEVIIQARALIEQANLLINFGKDSGSVVESINLLERVLDKKVFSNKAGLNEMQAEASFMRAGLLARMGLAEKVIPACEKLIQEFPEVNEWADRAVDKILDLTLSGIKSTDDQKNLNLINQLTRLANSHKDGLPRLSSGALNRIGDISFDEAEWARAKGYYRQVLEQFPGQLKEVSTNRAAAGMALAEILYREERFREALELYEREMSDRSGSDYLYQVARKGYIQKSLVAAEYHFQLGEIAAARSIYAELIKYDYLIVEAHRGYIQCAAIYKKIPQVIGAYRAISEKDPNDPVALYSTGLCLTYLNNQKAAEEALSLIRKAIGITGQVEYFYQTGGYLFEILETVYGKPDGLESALDSYLKALFLNNPLENPGNNADLNLNLGNIYFLLKNYGKAHRHYMRRLESGRPFDNEDTEILFYRRLGASAFQIRDSSEPVTAYSQTLDLIEKKVRPKQASELLGRINRLIIDRVTGPAMKNPGTAKIGKGIAKDQAGLNKKLFDGSSIEITSPLDPEWEAYQKGMELLISEQEKIIRDMEDLIKKNDLSDSLSYLIERAKAALTFPEHLLELKAEMLDRLGLAFQEAEKWKEARATFEKAFELNKRLGLTQNLVNNRRSAAYNAYMEAGFNQYEIQYKGQNKSGRKTREDLLHISLGGFRDVISLVDKYGVPEKGGNRQKEAMVNLAFDIALDSVNATQAMSGFTADQEKRIAEAFIHRIQIELGNIHDAFKAVQGQLSLYPDDKAVSDNDIYGVALLFHRAGNLAHAMKRYSEAFSYYKRSASLCQRMKAPVSMALNVRNMAKAISEITDEVKDRDSFIADLIIADRMTGRLLDRFSATLGPRMIPNYHNAMGVWYLSLWQRFNERDQKGSENVQILLKSRTHFVQGLKWINKKEVNEKKTKKDREVLRASSILHLNNAGICLITGDEYRAREQYKQALSAARKGMHHEYEWRALAGLGRLDEAMKSINSVTLLKRKWGKGEVLNSFAPEVEAMIKRGKAEEAFNLIEHISEIERVGRLAPISLGKISNRQKELLRNIYPRLHAIKDLKKNYKAAKGEEKAYLKTRLAQEREIFIGQAGEGLNNLPQVIVSIEEERLRNGLITLLGIAVHIDELAEEIVGSKDREKEGSPGKEYSDLQNLYRKEVKEIRTALMALDSQGIAGVFISNPVEAIDLMESIAEDEKVVRLFALDRRGASWAAITVTVDDIQGKIIKGREIDRLVEDRHILAYEDLESLHFDARAGIRAGLSATHLVRSIRNRKPFKKKVMAIPFKDKSIQADNDLPPYFLNIPVPDLNSNLSLKEEIIKKMPDVNTLSLGGGVYLAESVANRPGEVPSRFIALKLDREKQFPLKEVKDSLSNLSLAILPGSSLKDAYHIGHYLSFFGVPTILIPETPEKGKEFLKHFFSAYEFESVSEAATKAGDSIKENRRWILLGDRGLTPDEAARFAKKRFNLYVKKGAKQFKEKNYSQALRFMENALNVALESKPRQRYLPDIYRYAIESSFKLGLIDKALEYSESLVALLAKKQWGSNKHAEALLQLGLLYALDERYEKALPPLEEAIEMMADLELDSKRIKALGELGIVLENSTEYEKALIRFRAAETLSGKTAMKKMLAQQKIRIGRIYDLRLSQYAVAIGNYQGALELYQELGQHENMALTLRYLGRCYRLLGNFVKAKELYDRGLSLADKHGLPEKQRVRILLEKANNAWFQARFQEAFDLQREVIETGRKNSWAMEQVMSLNTAGLIWWSLGNYQKGLNKLNEALSLSEGLRKRRDEKATTLNNIGLVYRDMGRYEDALNRFDKALQIDKELRSQWAIAYDLRNKAITYSRMGNPAAAVPLLDEALNITKKTGNKINEAKVLLAYAEALVQLKRYPEARMKFKDALALSGSMALREAEWRALFGLGQIDLKEGNKEEAGKYLGRSIKVIEGIRSEIKIDQLKDGFITNKMGVYKTMVSLLVDLGRTAEAFDIAERSRARNIIDLLGNQRLSLYGSVDQKLYDRQRQLRSVINEQEQLFVQSGADREREVYAGVLKQLEEDYDDLMLEIQRKNPELTSLVSVDPLALEDVQKLLNPDIALLAYYILDDRVLCWVIRSDRYELVQTSIDQKTLEKGILAYRRMLQNLEPVEGQSRELYSWLLKDISGHLSNIKAVGVIPHGNLHYLSFATLNDGVNYVADRFPLFYLPSASVFQYTVDRRKENKLNKVLAIGNPLLDESALELPFAEREVSTIGWNFPDITVLTKDRARESWVVDHIEEFGIIHIASHGEFDPINPLFSSVKLTGDMRADGNLEAAEVFGLKINADLVLLSACQTGLGKITGGDDVIGMNRAFLYAGSHAMISSLWRVSDISTALLVKEFYRRYVSRNKSDSLRRAILHVKNRYPHPGYWGAFVLVGDYE